MLEIPTVPQPWFEQSLDGFLVDDIEAILDVSLLLEVNLGTTLWVKFWTKTKGKWYATFMKVHLGNKKKPCYGKDKCNNLVYLETLSLWLKTLPMLTPTTCQLHLLLCHDF